jgi:hypothetical protein
MDLDMLKWVSFVQSVDAAAEQGGPLDVIMPNGKKLRDCTGVELGEISAWVSKMSGRVDEPSLDRVVAWLRMIERNRESLDQ